MVVVVFWGKGGAADVKINTALAPRHEATGREEPPATTL